MGGSGLVFNTWNKCQIRVYSNKWTKLQLQTNLDAFIETYIAVKLAPVHYDFCKHFSALSVEKYDLHAWVGHNLECLWNKTEPQKHGK